MAVVVVLLVFFFVVIPAIAVPLAIASMGNDERRRRKALADEAVILAGTFAGEGDVVVKVGPDTLPYENYVLGAKARGYRLLSTIEEAGHRQTVIFTPVGDR
jgi:hypothetical protein